MESNDSLTVPVHADGVARYKFTIDGGAFMASVQWASCEEIYTDVTTIRIPPDVWAKAWPWLLEKMKQQATG